MGAANEERKELGPEPPENYRLPKEFRRKPAFPLYEGAQYLGHENESNADIDAVNAYLENQDFETPEEHQWVRAKAKPAVEMIGTAEILKTRGNELLMQAKYVDALRVYHEGIWVLHSGEYDYNKDKEINTEGLGKGGAGRGEEFCKLAKDFDFNPANEPPEGRQLRILLHLNFALCAMKLEKWRSAQVACEFVVSEVPFVSERDHVKALFRLAQAFEGQGEYTEAQRAAFKAGQLDPNNAAVRDLLKSVATKAGYKKKERKDMAESMLREGDIYDEEEEKRKQRESQQQLYKRNLPEHKASEIDPIEVLAGDDQATIRKKRLMRLCEGLEEESARQVWDRFGESGSFEDVWTFVDTLRISDTKKLFGMTAQEELYAERLLEEGDEGRNQLIDFLNDIRQRKSVNNMLNEMPHDEAKALEKLQALEMDPNAHPSAIRSARAELAYIREAHVRRNLTGDQQEQLRSLEARRAPQQEIWDFLVHCARKNKMPQAPQ